ncbi:MAG: type I restriction enzyme HsdR N-terminal domain-containing protein [Muribaculaceae bacterium]|nr:type I restriction enzyme HsdR N-terminal domain-containing protein [Muribaculaceae bacterium]
MAKDFVMEKAMQTELYDQAVKTLGRLLLPRCDLKLRIGHKVKEFEVYDVLRRKYVALTPEEWVRAHFVDYMVTALDFSPLRMANEVSIILNNTKRRADTVVYDDVLQPLVIVEYKAPSIHLSESVLHQALRYNLVFQAKAVIITNGMDVYTVMNGVVKRGVVKYADIV